MKKLVIISVILIFISLNTSAKGSKANEKNKSNFNTIEAIDNATSIGAGRNVIVSRKGTPRLANDSGCVYVLCDPSTHACYELVLLDNGKYEFTVYWDDVPFKTYVGDKPDYEGIFPITYEPCVVFEGEEQ